MDATDVLMDLFSRVRSGVRSVAEGLGPDDLVWAPAEGANPIGWLLWHLTRVEDGHVAEVAGHDQVRTEGGWAERFGLATADPHDSGWGHTPEQVAAVRPVSAAACVEYHW